MRAPTLWLVCVLSVTSGNENTNVPGVDRFLAGRSATALEDFSDVVRVKSGDQAKLTCPASSDPALPVQWTKDGQAVDRNWSGLRLGRRAVLIPSATAELAGLYRCHTSYGTTLHQTSLVVTDRTGGADQPPVGPASRRKLPARGHRVPVAAPPRITRVHPHRATVRKKLGGKVRFRCEASGWPRPDIRWFKDGVELPSSGGADDRSSGGQLSLTRLGRLDSGVYECRVSSAQGRDAARLRLDVLDPFEEKPKIVGDEPRNMTVDAGNKVTLQCRVTGSPPLQVMWLKRTKQRPAAGADWTAGAAELEMLLDEQLYRTLNASESVSSRPDEQLVKLTLPRSRPEDAGLYICLGSNNGGFTSRAAHLNVRDAGPGPSPPPPPPSDPAYLVLLVPIVVVTTLALAAISCLCYVSRLPPTSCGVDLGTKEALMGHSGVQSGGTGAERWNRSRTAASRPHDGNAVSCSSQPHHVRRYHPLPLQPSPGAGRRPVAGARPGPDRGGLECSVTSGWCSCRPPARNCTAEIRSGSPAQRAHAQYVC